MNKPETSSILGVNVAITDMKRAINYIKENKEALKGEYVCFTNVHTTVMSYENPKYRKVQNGAHICMPDGSPLSYIQRLRGYQNARQVAGPDFMTALFKATENSDCSHYFFGGSQETIDRLKKVLKDKYPGLKIAGMESPPFRPLSEKEDEEAVERINSSGADFVWIGLGAPKQEEWMQAHKGRINAVMLGVGAGFDFHAGTVKRAPKWMREHYLEWLYRLTQDPSRLWKRYVTTNVKFVSYIFRNAVTGDEHIKPDKKRLLIYAHYYYPDVASTGQILTDLAEGLKDRFDITVICTVPSYDGKVARKYRTHKYYHENINGIKVIRVRVPEFRKSNKLSRINNITSYFFAAISATLRVGKTDYVYSISQPPIMGGVLGVIGSRLKKAKLIYNIQDFNPEQTMAVGYFSNKALLNTVMAIDKYSCRKADKVIVVGRDMVDTLKNRFKNEKKIPSYTCINNWIDEQEITPLPRNHEKIKELRQQYGLNDKFVIMYSGNIGLYYDLVNIMKVLKKFKDNDKVAFLFAGEGSVKERLEEYAKENSLKNVIFASYQEKKQLAYSLGLADVHFVVNSKGIKGVSVPSKLYGVMASGRPVLGILEEGTEARTIIDEAQCGISVAPGDYDAIEKLIKTFIDMDRDKLEEMGKKGRKYLDEYLTREISIRKYGETIGSL